MLIFKQTTKIFFIIIWGFLSGVSLIKEKKTAINFVLQFFCNKFQFFKLIRNKLKSNF